MGGSLMVAAAVPPDAIEAPNGAVVPVGHALHNTMPSHLIAILVQEISAGGGVADATATPRKRNN
jgi:hypothetical protein